MSARLLIDCGNTRLKWARVVDDRLGAVQAIVHHGDPAAALETSDFGAVDAVAIANVTGPEHGERLCRHLGLRLRKPVAMAQVQPACLGLRVAYADASRLGVDRWLALLAAWTRGQGAACVAAVGTALTFDALDARGQHLGGVIAPGLIAAQTAVLGSTRFAAGGPSMDFEPGLGRDTEACVRQGALHAGAGMLDRLAARHPEATRWLTGGDAARLQPHLSADWTLDEALVLEGLHAWACQAA